MIHFASPLHTTILLSAIDATLAFVILRLTRPFLVWAKLDKKVTEEQINMFQVMVAAYIVYTLSTPIFLVIAYVIQ